MTVHLWSLSLEEQFYFFWPNVYKRLKFSNLLEPTLGITFGIALWRGVSLTFGLVSDRIGLYYMRPYFRFDSILIGCLFSASLGEGRRFSGIREENFKGRSCRTLLDRIGKLDCLGPIHLQSSVSYAADAFDCGVARATSLDRQRTHIPAFQQSGVTLPWKDFLFAISLQAFPCA